MVNNCKCDRRWQELNQKVKHDHSNFVIQYHLQINKSTDEILYTLSYQSPIVSIWIIWNDALIIETSFLKCKINVKYLI